MAGRTATHQDARTLQGHAIEDQRCGIARRRWIGDEVCRILTEQVVFRQALRSGSLGGGDLCGIVVRIEGFVVAHRGTLSLGCICFLCPLSDGPRRRHSSTGRMGWQLRLTGPFASCSFRSSPCLCRLGLSSWRAGCWAGDRRRLLGAYGRDCRGRGRFELRVPAF